MSYDLGGSGGASFPFDKIGDSVTGTIVDVEEMQQHDFDNPGQLAYWPDGKPKMMHAVTLQTELHDDADDDGLRSIYLRGSRKAESKSLLAAVIAAVRATTGSTAIDKGGTLTVTFVGEVPPTQRGRNPAKQYDATYRPPSASTDIGGGAQATGAGYASSAQQPLPVQQQQPQHPAPQQVQQQQPQLNGNPPGLKGFLNGSPITDTQYAGMVAAGVTPDSLAGWIAI
jgi:hypothetical protein